MTEATSRVMLEVAEERRRQDGQWGGPEHDDSHEPEEWMNFIEAQLEKTGIESCEDADHADARYCARMVKIAALAVAAVESIERHHERQNDRDVFWSALKRVLS